MSVVTFSAKPNPKRNGETTYRIGKSGTSAFLLFGVDDVRELHKLLGRALEGTYGNQTEA